MTKGARTDKSLFQYPFWHLLRLLADGVCVNARTLNDTVRRFTVRFKTYRVITAKP